MSGKIEGGAEVMERQGRRRKQLVGHLKKRRGCWKLKKEALVCIMSRTRLRRDYGRVIRQTTE
jgi:hypothetical protein